MKMEECGRQEMSGRRPEGGGRERGPLPIDGSLLPTASPPAPADGSRFLPSRAPLSPPSLLPGPSTCFFPPPLFKRQLASPGCRHPEVSHLLPITFGCSWFAAIHLGQGGVWARSRCSGRH